MTAAGAISLELLGVRCTLDRLAGPETMQEAETAACIHLDVLWNCWVSGVHQTDGQAHNNARS